MTVRNFVPSSVSPMFPCEVSTLMLGVASGAVVGIRRYEGLLALDAVAPSAGYERNRVGQWRRQTGRHCTRGLWREARVVGSSVGGVRVVVTAIAQPDGSTDDADYDDHAERSSGYRHLLALAGTFCATFELTLELAFRRLAALLVLGTAVVLRIAGGSWSAGRATPWGRLRRRLYSSSSLPLQPENLLAGQQLRL
ncbi:hypothetical protein ACETU7_02995 [Rhodococcus sp. 3Y1]